MALCSLSTGRIGTWRRRAAAITRCPAITSTSLLASAMALPASMAASTASSAAVPDEAQSTMSTSGRVARATSPAPPWPANSTRSSSRSASAVRSTASAGSVAIATARGRNRPTCSARRTAFSPAARPTTWIRPGWASTTASALRPIEPVEPRIAIRFTVAMSPQAATAHPA